MKIMGAIILASILCIVFMIAMLALKIMLFINNVITIGGIGSTLILALLILFLVTRNKKKME
jgi:hypothetical protein